MPKHHQYRKISGSVKIRKFNLTKDYFFSIIFAFLFILNLANFHPMVKGFELPIYLFATVKCQGCWNMSSCACPFFGRIQFFRTSNQRIMAQSFFKMRPYLFSTTLSHTFTSRPGPGIFLRECQQIANFQNPNRPLILLLIVISF